MDVDRENNLDLARMAEYAQRYNEMVDAMKTIVKMGYPLTPEERNLLSAAYKNATSALRASWRVLVKIEVEKKRRNDDTDGINSLTEKYRKQIESELKVACEDILKLINEDLIPSVAIVRDEESVDENSDQHLAFVFYHKLKGDYLRYLAEVSRSSERQELSDQALSSYDSALQTAELALPATHLIRLGTALNFSVFLNEIWNSPGRACRIAQKAVDEAVAEVESLSEEEFKDTTVILQLLRDNISLWTSELQTFQSQDL